MSCNQSEMQPVLKIQPASCKTEPPQQTRRDRAQKGRTLRRVLWEPPPLHSHHQGHCSHPVPEHSQHIQHRDCSASLGGCLSSFKKNTGRNSKKHANCLTGPSGQLPGTGDEFLLISSRKQKQSHRLFPSGPAQFRDWPFCHPVLISAASFPFLTLHLFHAFFFFFFPRFQDFYNASPNSSVLLHARISPGRAQVSRTRSRTCLVCPALGGAAAGAVPGGVEGRDAHQVPRVARQVLEPHAGLGQEQHLHLLRVVQSVALPVINLSGQRGGVLALLRLEKPSTIMSSTIMSRTSTRLWNTSRLGDSHLHGQPAPMPDHAFWEKKFPNI